MPDITETNRDIADSNNKISQKIESTKIPKLYNNDDFKNILKRNMDQETQDKINFLFTPEPGMNNYNYNERIASQLSFLMQNDSILTPQQRGIFSQILISKFSLGGQFQIGLYRGSDGQSANVTYSLVPNHPKLMNLYNQIQMSYGNLQQQSRLQNEFFALQQQKMITITSTNLPSVMQFLESQTR